MVWPSDLPAPEVQPLLPPEVLLRTCLPGDLPGFYALMADAGWPGWDAERLRSWLYRILPGGWFILEDLDNGEIIGTSMATHDHTWIEPFCGEVGWTAVHPRHQGKGLGSVVVAAVLARFRHAGYTCIHLYTEIWRLAALKMYLKLGFVPWLDPPEARQQWQSICAQLGWPFKPDRWP